MTDVLKHGFVSAKTDGADATQVQPSHWNAGHKFTGGAAGDVLTRDPTDAAFGAKWLTPTAPTPGVDQVIADTSTGTVNNWAPAGFGTRHTVILWTGTANVAISGLKAGVDGQVVRIKNRGTGIMTFAHAGAGSLAANRFSNFATSGQTPIALGGAIEYIYLSGLWYLVGHDQGSWITPVFNAADFDSFGGQAWTVGAADVVVCQYLIFNRTIDLIFSFQSTTIGGGSHPALTWRFPGGFLQQGVTMQQATLTAQQGAAARAVAQAALNAAYTDRLLLYKDLTGGTNWSANTDGTNIEGCVRIPII